MTEKARFRVRITQINDEKPEKQTSDDGGWVVASILLWTLLLIAIASMAAQ